MFMRVGTMVRSPQKRSVFRPLLFAVASGNLGTVIQEAVEGLREVRSLVAFGPLVTQANVPGGDSQRAQLAGQPVEWRGRSASGGGPGAIWQRVQRHQKLFGTESSLAALGKDLANIGQQHDSNAPIIAVVGGQAGVGFQGEAGPVRSEERRVGE